MGYSTEPGSTFKLASLLAVMDDGYADLDDKFNVGNGTCKYYTSEMNDSHTPPKPDLTLQEIFELSSNVGVSKIITKYYTKDPQKFVDKLKSFNLDRQLGLNIPGEGIPRIKNARDKDWYGTTLPWMSIGYESLITPLQTLSLYNAIANNGVMVKPHFLTEIRSNGKTVKKFEPEIINPAIVKHETVEKARRMMEGVVERGTGKGLNVTAFKVAGKTGTAQISVIGKNYGGKGNHSYQASFVGYFPAEKPLYTCIVIIYSPSKGAYYGGLVAGPVFKEIAEKVYSNSVDFHQEINAKKTLLTKAPEVIKGNKEDMTKVLSSLNIPFNGNVSSSEWVFKSAADSLKLDLLSSHPDTELKNGMIPNLYGMSAKDALFLLENNGLNVRLQGAGTVKKQLPEAGTKFNKGAQITITLG
jgi:cell division protein FtsI (penicillin-binding protein 3)